MDSLEHFVHGIEQHGHRLDARKYGAFERYLGEIRRVNGRLGLISRNDLARIPTRHFLDSVMPVMMGIMSPVGAVIDVGSGGGLPGIPLAIMLPENQFVLVESNRKKCAFLGQARRVLGLENVNVCNMRMEMLPEEDPGVLYDVALARAVGTVGQLAGWCGSVLKPGARLICYKGPGPEEEIEAAAPVMEAQDMVWEGTYPYEEGNTGSPTLVVLKKR